MRKVMLLGRYTLHNDILWLGIAGLLFSNPTASAVESPSITPETQIIEEIQEEAIDTIVPELPEYLSEDDFSLLYSYKEEKANDTCLEISYSDAQILMKIAAAEDNTDATSQAYIMSVVLNRVQSPDFPNTVRGVVEQTGQFSPVGDGRFAKSTPDANSHIALAMVESGEITTEFLYFEAASLKGSWQSKHRGGAYEYGGTRFYR